MFSNLVNAFLQADLLIPRHLRRGTSAISQSSFSWWSPHRSQVQATFPKLFVEFLVAILHLDNSEIDQRLAEGHDDLADKESRQIEQHGKVHLWRRVRGCYQ